MASDPLVMNKLRYSWTSAETPKIGTFAVSLDHIVVKAYNESPALGLNMCVEKVKGTPGQFNITYSLGSFGKEVYNKKPYTDRGTAIKKFADLVKRMETGNYLLEVYPNNRLQLKLKVTRAKK